MSVRCQCDEAGEKGVDLVVHVADYCAWLTDDMWKSGIRSDGMAARVAQSPHSRGRLTSLTPASVARRSRSSGLSLKRKLFTAAVTSPSSIRYTPSLVSPVSNSMVGSTSRMYHSVVSTRLSAATATLASNLAAVARG